MYVALAAMARRSVSERASWDESVMSACSSDALEIATARSGEAGRWVEAQYAIKDGSVTARGCNDAAKSARFASARRTYSSDEAQRRCWRASESDEAAANLRATSLSMPWTVRCRDDPSRLGG